MTKTFFLQTSMVAVLALVVVLGWDAALVAAFSGNGRVSGIIPSIHDGRGTLSSRGQQTATTTALNLLNNEQQLPAKSKETTTALDAQMDPIVPVAFGTLVAAYTIYKYSEFVELEAASPTPAKASPTPAPASPSPAPASDSKPQPVPVAKPVGAPATAVKKQDEEVQAVEVDEEKEEKEPVTKKTIRFVKFLYAPWLGMIPEIKRMLKKEDK